MAFYTKQMVWRHPESDAGGGVVAEEGGELLENERQEAGDSAQGAFDQAALRRMVQAAVDRATNKLGNDNKKLREEAKRLTDELAGKLTDEEKARLELTRRQEELAAREAELRDRESRLFAVKAIKAAGLDDGSEDALGWVDVVNAGDEAKTRERAALIKQKFDAAVQARVDGIFKEQGHTPQKGGAGAPQGDSKKRLAQAIETGNPAEVAYWTRRVGQENNGG